MEIASVTGVQAGNDSLGDLLNVVIDIQFCQLMEKEVIERLGPLHRIGHQIVLAITVLLDAA
ncbi:MAG: hypothetical protein ACKOAH_19185, partial [Pirellula sp.]